jgi:hypothetical protein
MAWYHTAIESQSLQSADCRDLLRDLLRECGEDGMREEFLGARGVGKEKFIDRYLESA